MLLKLAAAIATLLLLAVGADAVTLDAHLAIDPRPALGRQQFTECSECPTYGFRTISGATRPITVSMQPIYSIESSDIEGLKIFEERSPHIIGAVTYHVTAEPSAAWKSQTQQTRDSYPYESIAWLVDGQLLAIARNINFYVGGMYTLAMYSCENDALSFAERLGHPATVIRQSEAKYMTDVKRLNAYYTEFSVELQEDATTPPEIVRLLSEGIPRFPVTAGEYFGREHKLPECR